MRPFGRVEFRAREGDIPRIRQPLKLFARSAAGLLLLPSPSFDPLNQHFYFTSPQWATAPEEIFRAGAGGTSSAHHQRGSATYFTLNEIDLVLKKYRRGGWLSRFVNDRYLFMGLARTRMGREYRLLQELRRRGLPVPEPVVARCCRHGWLFYSGELITARLNDTETLGARLQRQPLSAGEWASLGQTIAKFHFHGVYHADLNVENILLGGMFAITLIDFDKSGLRPSRSRQWISANHRRLLRSLKKGQSRCHQFHFAPADWQIYLSAHAKSLHHLRKAGALQPPGDTPSGGNGNLEIDSRNAS